MKDKLLPPIRPNAGVEALYRQRLDRLIAEMNASVKYWIGAAFKANEPEVIALLAMDRSPAAVLRAMTKRLARRWQKKFNELAPDLAKYFATDVSRRADGALKSILKKGGMSVEFRMTPATNDILQATIGENVALIKSIPAQYFTQIEGMVMRSVSAGRDLKQLTDDIEAQYGVTRRRAAFIARDQNNKSTANVTKARRLELGITEAIWLHSGGGKEPRPSHVKAGRDRVKFDIRQGWWDPAINKRIWPGTEPGCRCVSRAVIPGLHY